MNFLKNTGGNTKKEGGNIIECFYCETSFSTKAAVMIMINRKTNHAKTLRICTRFANKYCNRNKETCWFKHETEEAEKEETKESNEKSPFFWKLHSNLKKS